MKPVDIENEILVMLRRFNAKNESSGMTLKEIHRSVSPATGEGPGWREVANATCRLQRMGLAAIVGEAQIGEDCHPLYGLTAAGVQAAHAARIQQHQRGKEVRA